MNKSYKLYGSLDYKIKMFTSWKPSFIYLSIKLWERLRYVNKILIMYKIKYLLKQVSKIPVDI